MQTYIPDESTRIVHYTSVDFTKRTVQTPIHLVQYDSSLPIIAITLMKGTNEFNLPTDAVAELRYGKNDYTFVIADALGQSADGSICYFEIPYQMTVEAGEHHPVVSIWIDDKIAASSTINVIIDRNPVQNEQIESLTDYTALRKFRSDAEESAKRAKVSEDNAKKSEEAAVKAAEQTAKDAEQTAKDAAQTKSDVETMKAITKNLGDGGLVYTIPEDGKLSKDSWIGTTNSDGDTIYTQDLVATGVTATNFVVTGVDNTDEISYKAYSDNSVRPVAQKENAITYQAESKPEVDIKIATLVYNNSLTKGE